MIIKSHIQGKYQRTANYLKNKGDNEVVRLIEMSDPDAQNLDDALYNMWTIACNTKATKPLHHISINPCKDERLSDEDVLKVVERCEDHYSYSRGLHQRIIIEHILKGRQHFHVLWNRVSLLTGKVAKLHLDWFKSMRVAREMEQELGLKSPIPRRIKRRLFAASSLSRKRHSFDRYHMLRPEIYQKIAVSSEVPVELKKSPSHLRAPLILSQIPFPQTPRVDEENTGLLIDAWQQGRLDALSTYGINLDEVLEP